MAEIIPGSSEFLRESEYDDEGRSASASAVAADSRRSAKRLAAHGGIGGVGKLGEVPGSQSLSQDSISVSTSHPYFWASFILVGEGK